MENDKKTDEIKAIFFDLGNVIVKFDDKILEKGYGEHCKMKPGKFLEYLADSKDVDMYMCGKTTSSQFYSRATRAFKLKMKFYDFYHVWNSMFWKYPEVEEIILGLREKYPHIKLILLSNTNEQHFNFIRKEYGVLEVFDGFIVSHEVGRQKPKVDIYNAAIKLSGCVPKDIFYTDDVAKFIDAARVLGIKAFQFIDHNKLRSDLSRFGVIV